MKLSELRAAFVEVSTQGQHSWWKVGQTVGQLEAVSDPTQAVAWLESHGYQQRGAMIGSVPRLAVFWLKENDQPENLAGTLGERIVPATCAWYPIEQKIGTTRTAGQIRRHRSRLGSIDQRDLQFVEQPTHAALMHAYGLA